MKNFGTSAALAAALLCAPAAAPAQTTADTAMQSARYLVGSWTCTHAIDTTPQGTSTMTFAPALEGRWLKQNWDFPAAGTSPAVRSEYLLGYDPRVSRWVRFGAHSNGMYFGMVTTSATDRAWAWRYVLPGNGTKPETIWTKKSDTEFTIDGPTYPVNGTPVTEHHGCTKSP
jgi:hypothetical protein